METSYWVSLSYATFGIITDENNIVIKTAPIGSWMLKKDINQIINWVEKKQGKIIRL